MQKIALSRADPMSRFHNALYAGDVVNKIQVLRDVGLCKFFSRLRLLDFLPFDLDPLAYLTTKTIGMFEVAQKNLGDADLTEADVDDAPTFALHLRVPHRSLLYVGYQLDID